MNDNVQLDIKELTTTYGKNTMLLSVSLQIPAGECICLLGSNGAGKTTFIKAVLGLVRIVDGRILFEGKDVTGQKTFKAIREGIAIVPEGKRIFGKMNVLENLRMGAYTEADKSVIDERYEKVFNHFPRLRDRAGQIAGTLSGGEQSMLAIGRGLMANPKMMIFDEPSLGLAPVLVRDTFGIITEINKSGITVCLVEQNAHMSLNISDYGYFLQKGQIIASGTAEELQDFDVIRSAYFG